MGLRSRRRKLNMAALVTALALVLPATLCACSPASFFGDLMNAATQTDYVDAGTDTDTRAADIVDAVDPDNTADTAAADEKAETPDADTPATDIEPDAQPDDDASDEPSDDTPDEPEESDEPDVSSDEPAAIVDITNSAYSYNDMARDLALLQERYGDLLSVFTIGTSVDGRNLYGVRLGPETAPKTVLVTAGIHAREYLGVSLVMAQLEYYLINYNTGSYAGVTFSDLFASCAVILLPMLNPDGVVLCQEGVAGLQTEQAVQAITHVYELDMAAGLLPETYTIDTYCRTCLKANVNGVDLNRNYPAGWASYRKMLQPSMKNYKGTSAASEPETLAVMVYLYSLSNVAALVAVHTQGEVIYWDCGQTGDLRQDTLALAEEVGRITGYNCIDEQNNDASLTDWAVLSLGIPSVTVEVGTGSKYPLDYTQAGDVFDVNANLWAAVCALYSN